MARKFFLTFTINLQTAKNAKNSKTGVNFAMSVAHKKLIIKACVLE
jgi:hypothetical protein